MNELIEKLAKQAFGSTIDTDPILVYEAEKFAELIVRECIEVVDDMADPEDSDRYFWAIQAVSQNIKKHFGVEE